MAKAGTMFTPWRAYGSGKAERKTERYIGKTERTLWERLNQHSYRDKDSVIYNHSTNRKGVNYLVDLLKH